MKKKTIVLTIILLFLIAGIGVGIYFYQQQQKLKTYDPKGISENYEEIINGIKITDTLTVKTDSSMVPTTSPQTSPEIENPAQENTTEKDLKTSKLVKFYDVSVKNDFKNFSILGNSASSNDTVKYVLNDNSGKTVASFWMGTTLTYTQLFQGDLIFFNVNDKAFQNFDRKKFLEEQDIKNDIDMIRYIEKNKLVESDIFSSTEQMKNNYIIKAFVTVAFPRLENITLLDGDYTGYILNTKEDLKEVNILKNNKRYVFTFIGLNYFTDEKINDLLNTIVIQ